MERYDHDGSIYPGVRTSDDLVNERQYHIFYQWVSFVLMLQVNKREEADFVMEHWTHSSMFQGIAFIIPRFIWKSLIEKNKIKYLTHGMREILTDEEEDKKRLKKLTKGFIKVKGKCTNYALLFGLLEIFNFIIVLSNGLLIEKFLQGKFHDLGFRLMSYWNSNDFDLDPMDSIFPKVAKCKFHKHGMGGGIQSHDALCVLPLNYVNEQIYLFLWVILIPLTFVSALAVLYRFLLLTCPWLRFYAMKKPSPKIMRQCKRLAWKLSYSDWFVLHLMSKNIAEDIYDKLVEEIIKEDDFTSLSKIC